ncbi:MAG: hybrid sensor histidine kinase/response regulator [Actinomycetota bacterium]
MDEGTRFSESLVERAPVVFFRRSADLESVTYVSPNSARVLGYEPDEITEGPGFWDAHIYDEDRRWYRRGLDGLTKQAQVEGEYRFVTPGDGYMWLHCIEYAERDDEGGLTGSIGYATDITERMTVLAVLRGAHAEMQSLNQELIEARDAAEAANVAKSEFLSGMSHEVRTPLNAILGFAQLLGMAPLEEDEREGIDEILKGGRHLLSLVDEVLDIARIEAGNLSLSIEPVSLDDVCEESLALVRPLADNNGVTVTGPSGDVPHHVMADRQRVKQVLLNLLSNGIKYNREGGTVRVGVDVLGEHVVVAVEDTGPGIPRHKMEALFTPFDRLGAEQTQVEGTGLGLPLARRLVEAMNGRITVSSNPGHGSIFSVHLRVADEPLVPAVRDVASERAGPAYAELEGRTIIYVEDNVSNLKLVEHILERRPAAKLHAALQGRLGVDLIRQHHPDLVLLDLNLGDIHGAQVLAQLKADPDTAGIPVVIISADATAHRVQETLAAGALEYLTKPLDVGRFLAVLDELLWPGESITLLTGQTT